MISIELGVKMIRWVWIHSHKNGRAIGMGLAGRDASLMGKHSLGSGSRVLRVVNRRCTPRHSCFLSAHIRRERATNHMTRRAFDPNTPKGAAQYSYKS